MSEQLSLFERVEIQTPLNEIAIADAMKIAIERYRAERPPLERNHTVPGKNPVSHDAARRAFGRSGNARERIYNVIKAHPDGLTVHELRQLITMHLEGWLVDSGQRRPTDTGAMATVWVVAND